MHQKYKKLQKQEKNRKVSLISKGAIDKNLFKINYVIRKIK